jgi:hypothetical protein
MRPSATRLLTLAISATAIVVVTATAGEASSRHVRKHHKPTSLYYRDSWGAGGIRPIAPGGWVCPGMARSFDCKIWPPPMNDDPDRKASGADA